MRSTEYNQAKDIVTSLDVNEDIHISLPGSLTNFRKYLREIGSKAGKDFTTRYRPADNSKLRVIRIK